MSPLFFSTEHDGPFEECCSCRLPFGESAYLVSKAFQGEECIYEYAVCEECQDNLSADFSEESKRDMQAFFEKRVDVEALFEKCASRPGPEPWLEACSVCGQARGGAEVLSGGGALPGGRAAPLPAAALPLRGLRAGIQRVHLGEDAGRAGRLFPEPRGAGSRGGPPASLGDAGDGLRFLRLGGSDGSSAGVAGKP